MNNAFRKITVFEENIVMVVMFQNLLGSLYLFLYTNKNVSVKPLSLVCITSFFYTIYPLRNVSVCGKHFVRCFQISINVIHQPRLVRIICIISINDYIK